MRLIQVCVAVLISAVIVIMTGCGGGGANNSGGGTPVPTIQSIQVSPASARIPKGLSQQFTATARYSDNSSRNVTASVNWTATPAGIVTVSSSGSALATAEGDVTISASSGAFAGSAQMKVDPAQLTSVSVTLPAKLMLGQVVELKATGQYTDGSSKDLGADADWKLSNPNVLQIANPGSVNVTSTSAPVASASRMGITKVSATFGGMSSATEVVVYGYPKFVYVANQLDDSVSAYSVDAETGGLKGNGYAFTVQTAFTRCFTLHPSAQFGYAVNFWPQGGQNGALPSISLMSIQSDGTLKQVGIPKTVGTRPGCISVNPNGKFAYLPFADDKDVAVYRVNESTGELTEVLGAQVSVGNEAWSVAVDPTGRFLYVPTVDKIFGYTIDSSGGTLTAIPGSPFSGWPDGNDISIEPSGRFAYVVDPSAKDITVFTIDQNSGALQEVADARLDTGGLNPVRPVFDRSGRFVYVLNGVETWGKWDNGTITTFQIDNSSGKLTRVGEPVITGKIPQAAALDVDGLGKYLYLTTWDNYVELYLIDSSTGTLTKSDKFATRSGAAGIGVVSGPASIAQVTQHAWVLNRDSNTISTLGFDSVAGLVPLSSISVPAGTTSLAVERRGKWAYATQTTSGVFEILQVDALGALTPFYNFDLPGRGPIGVETDYSGTAVYLANSFTNSISAFNHYQPTQVNPFVDESGKVAQFPSGATPTIVKTDPNDRYLYVFNTGDASVSWYEIRPFWGFPTEVSWATPPSPVPFAPGVKAVEFEPTGQFLYAISGDSLLGFYIDYSRIAAPAPIEGFSPVSLSHAAAMVSDSAGRRLYVADSNGVHVFTIDRMTGKLSAIGTASAGANPKSMAIAASGDWLYLVDEAIGVEPFSIDKATGTLSSHNPIVTGATPVDIALDAMVN